MKILAIIYSILMTVMVVSVIVFGIFYEYLPQVFNKKAYRAWKHVMSLKRYNFSEMYSYMERNIEWHVNIYFEDDPDYTCTIFKHDGEIKVLIYHDDEVLFSSFWKKHAKELVDRFMPEIGSMEIVHL